MNRVLPICSGFPNLRQSYRAYERSHEIVVAGKSPILGSSDVAFRGDKTKYNPEELLVASLSTCFVANSMNFPVLCEPSIEIDNTV